jgi:hypothetical protein
MGRILITSWFILTALPGPGFCCCSLALAQHTTRTQVAAKPEPKPKHSCCQNSTQENTDKQTPLDHPRTPCPCQQQSQKHFLALDQDLKVEEHSFSHALLALLNGALLGNDCVDRGCPGESLGGRDATANLPFLSAHDLLFAHHLLRC